MNKNDLPIEDIPNEDFVYRNVPLFFYQKWSSKRRPNESDFMLREGESGLSVNWNKYCTPEENFVLIGLKKSAKSGKYLDPKTFRAIILNVGDVRSLNLTSNEPINIIHKPLKEPTINIAHAEILCEDEDEFRLKLCELIESYPDPFLKPDFNKVIEELKKRI